MNKISIRYIGINNVYIYMIYHIYTHTPCSYTHIYVYIYTLIFKVSEIFNYNFGENFSIFLVHCKSVINFIY